MKVQTSEKILNNNDYQEKINKLVKNNIASKLSQKDYTLWGKEAEPEASIRLGWLDVVKISKPLIAEIESLKTKLNNQGVTKIILCGMGGSSLAPEIITASHNVDLFVLDSTDPEMIQSVIDEGVEKAAVVISSKSGGTVETDSHRRLFHELFEQAGIRASDRIIVVTDPKSPLHETSIANNYRVFLADPNVGGRYSALTAFGLVPSGLAGANIAKLLDEAENALNKITEDSDTNSGLILGTILASGAPKINKVAITSDRTLPGFGDWAEQLIAESTGKESKGVLPVVLGSDAPELELGLKDLIHINASTTTTESSSNYTTDVTAPLGAQFVLWEFATAVTGVILEINPFDQPDVEAAKIAARSILENPPKEQKILFSENGLEISVSTELENSKNTKLTEILQEFYALAKENDYFAIQVYGDRINHKNLEEIRNKVAKKVARPVTFGWGPRFLHSTGQYHKGGPKEGLFIQVRFNYSRDINIPGKEFSFAKLIKAQAAGDAEVLQSHNRPVLVINVNKNPEAISNLISAFES